MKFIKLFFVLSVSVSAFGNSVFQTADKLTFSYDTSSTYPAELSIAAVGIFSNIEIFNFPYRSDKNIRTVGLVIFKNSKHLTAQELIDLGSIQFPKGTQVRLIDGGQTGDAYAQFLVLAEGNIWSISCGSYTLRRTWRGAQLGPIEDCFKMLKLKN